MLKCSKDEIYRCIEYPKAPVNFTGNKSNWRKDKECVKFGCVKRKPKKKETQFHKECKDNKFIIRCDKYTKGKTNKKCIQYGCYKPQKENYFWKTKKPVQKIVNQMLKNAPEIVSKLSSDEKKEVKKEIEKEVKKELKVIEKETKKPQQIEISKPLPTQKPQIKFQGVKSPEEQKAENFYDNILPLLGKGGKISTRAVNQILKQGEKYGIDRKTIERLLSLQELGFFPTGNSCIKTITDDIVKDFDPINKLNILEGTSGVGNVAFKISQIMPNSKITLNELVKDLSDFSKNLLDWNKNFKFSNENFFKLKNGDWNIIFLNPPYTMSKKPKYWIEFLLHGLRLINKSKARGKTLYLISPSLGITDVATGFFEIIKNPENRNPNLTITKEELRKAINEVENKNYSKKEFEENEQDILEPYEFQTVEKLADCQDFIRTNMKAEIYKFNPFPF